MGGAEHLAALPGFRFPDVQTLRTKPTTMITFLACVGLLVLLPPAHTMCPSRCQCNEEALKVVCVEARLEDVPIHFNPEIKHINLTHNKISSVHFTLNFYNNLVSLDVSYNYIKVLEAENFESQNNMAHLNISNNGITHLSKETFKGLVALKSLDLNSNQIESMHEAVFHDVDSLEQLDLSNNKIISFESDVFKRLVNLQVLILDSNQILDIPIDNLVYTTQLQHFSLSNNLVESVPKDALPMLRYLTHLALDNNVISEIHHTAFDGLASLQHLDLNDNNLTSIPTAQLSKLSNLTQLSLSGNFFDSIPPVSFQSLFQLRYLHLSRLDLLTKIDVRAFVDNIHLERVWMNDNIEISTIPTRLFHGNPRLTLVSIRNNAIETLEASHFPLDKLHRLQLGGNPLQCNCSLLWLWRLVRAQEHVGTQLNLSNSEPMLTIDVEQIKCAAPEHLQQLLLLELPESEIRCSVGWLTIITVVLTVSLVLSVATILYYIGALNRCGKKDKQSDLNGSQRPGVPPMTYGTHCQTNDKLEIERYMMAHAQSMNNEYHTLAPWEPINKNTHNSESAYHQLGYATGKTSKPHIVYV